MFLNSILKSLLLLIYINNISAAGLFGSGNGPEVTHESCNTYSDCVLFLVFFIKDVVTWNIWKRKSM